jgi:two-component system KDP operon response regulator KdpE
MDTLQGKRILVIDDEPFMCDLVERILAGSGAQVHSATSGDSGLAAYHTLQPDLVILDIMMPAPNGLEVCARMMEHGPVPIIFLSALGSDQDVVNGLELGAIDYVAKPFSPKVLLARIRAALRPAGPPTDPPTEAGTVYDDGYLAIDLNKRSVHVEGQRVQLTPNEWALLRSLYNRAGRIAPYRDILLEVWGPGYRESLDYVHVLISRLRQKLERDPRRPRYLITERGLGYRFVPQSTPQGPPGP